MTPTSAPAAAIPPDRRRALLAELLAERFGPIRELEAERHRKPEDTPPAVQHRQADLENP